MPDKEVKIVQDQIFYQYAKIVACSAFGLSDGREGGAGMRYLRDYSGNP